MSDRSEVRRRAAGGSARPALVFLAVFGVALPGIAISGCGQGVNDEPSKTRDVALVSLEAANTPGSSPWMESVTSTDPPRQVNRVETPAASRTVSGDQIGLYGGSADRVVCDREKMVDYLERNPVKAAAWRTATGAKDVRAYASGLSPGFLTYDTRVTNHGFKDGTATSFPSVLQTGTAVLLDNRGLPRVRCDSGSPLSEPRGDIDDDEFGGTGWQNLNPDSVVTVEKSEVPLEELKLIEVGADASQGPTATNGPAPAPVILRDVIGAAKPVVAPDIVLPDDLTVTSIPVQTVNITNSTPTSTTELTTTPSTTTTTESTTTESSTPTTTTEIIDTTPKIEPTDPSILPPGGGEIVPQDGALTVGEPRTVVVPTP